MQPARLTSHPCTPCDAVERIEVGASRRADALTLRFTLFGECARLKIPSTRALVRADALWRHTCFEAFIAPIGGDGYCEINLSPSHEWAIYAFDRYREGMRPMRDAGPEPVIVGSGPGYLSLVAHIELRDRQLAAQDWQLGICAVIEDAQGGLSYWALKHPGEKADFHDRNGFVLDLPA